MFTRIYEENFERLFFFALTTTRSQDLSKDIVSEVFLNLWKKKDKFSQIKQLESYLYICVKNEAINVLSKNSHVDHSVDLERDIKIIDKVDPEELLLEKELLKEIKASVSKLPDQCRLVFEMAKNQQMKYKEIALELGISVSTVRMQLIKANTIIKETITSKYRDDDMQSLRLGIIVTLLSCMLS